MKPSEYQTIRKSIGPMSKVATVLGVSKATISRREAGLIPITKEAELAILCVHYLNKIKLTKR